MSKVFRVSRFFSVVIFLTVFLYVYAFLPKDVNVKFLPDTIDKEMFFYLGIALFVLVNLVFTVLIVIYKNIGIANQPEKKQNIINWVVSLPVMINLYLTFMVGSIGIINNQSTFEGGAYAYLNYLGPILLLGWIFALIFILAKKYEIPSESTN